MSKAKQNQQQPSKRPASSLSSTPGLQAVASPHDNTAYVASNASTARELPPLKTIDTNKSSAVRQPSANKMTNKPNKYPPNIASIPQTLTLTPDPGSGSLPSASDSFRDFSALRNKSCPFCIARGKIKECAIVSAHGGAIKMNNQLEISVKNLCTKLNGCCRDGQGPIELDKSEQALVNVLARDAKPIVKKGKQYLKLGGCKNKRRLSFWKTSVGVEEIDVFLLHTFESTHEKGTHSSQSNYAMAKTLASEPDRWKSLLYVTEVDGVLACENATVHENGKRSSKPKSSNGKPSSKPNLSNYRITTNAF